MAWITRTELGQLSAITPDVLAALVAIDSGTTVDAAIAASESKLKGYIQSRYKLPITRVSEDCKQADADIAAWLLMSHYGFAQEGFDEVFRQRSEDALSWARDVARGIVSIDVETGDAPEADLEAICVSQTPRGW